MRAMQASLLTRFGSAAAVAVLAAGGAMATATAASAAGHTKPAKLDATTLSIKNKMIARHRHHTEVITGVLRDERKGVPNEAVKLESRTGKKRRWAVVGSGTTLATATSTAPVGSVTISIAAPTTRTQYKLVFAGDSTFRKSHSNVITVNGLKKK